MKTHFVNIWRHSTLALLPQGGTALAEAIQTARTAFKEAGEENHRALVLFTDGEDHDGQAIEAAAQAAKEGLVVFTIGLGSPNGELIPVRDAKGRVDFIKDENGNAVKSRLNESLLQDIAKAGKGFYLHLAGAGGMEMLYERGLAPLPQAGSSGDHDAALLRAFPMVSCCGLPVAHRGVVHPGFQTTRSA
jgi:Ca-activated chloride channel family protein